MKFYGMNCVLSLKNDLMLLYGFNLHIQIGLPLFTILLLRLVDFCKGIVNNMGKDQKLLTIPFLPLLTIP